MIRNVKLGSVAIEAKETVPSIPSGTPIVGLEHLDPGELTLSRWDITDKTTFTKTFKKGDVLFGRRRAYLKKAAVAPFDGVCSGDITVIRAMPNKIRPGLLAFLIQNDRFFAHAVKNSDGSLSPRAKWASLKEFAFALDDDLSIQDRILDILESINNTKLEYKEVLAKCDELIKSRFVEMFGSDPLVHNFAGVLVDQTKLGTKFLVDEYESNGDIPVIDQSSSFISGYKGREGNPEPFDQKCIIFGDHTELFKYVDFPFYLGADGTKILVSRKGWNTRFIYGYLLTHYKPRGGYARHFKYLKELRFPKPDLVRQAEFEAFFINIDKLKFNLQQAIDRAKKMSAKILNDALSAEE